MRIDVLDNAHFKIFEHDLRVILNNIHKEIQNLKKEFSQLQDRVKILEVTNEKLLY